jgi:hypothetical protein
MRSQIRHFVSTVAAGLTIAAIAFACSNSPDAPSARDVAGDSSRFVVSSPQTPAGATRDASSFGGGAGPSNVVYVALPPGSIPNAELITITVHPTGATLTAKPVDGGLDPVAVPATLGDTLYIDTRVSGSAVPVRNILPVGPHGRPVVIRTSPPHRKRDVPLNTDVLVVFSEPILPTSVTSSTVQLTTGTGQVQAQLAFTDSTHVMSTLTPLTPLSPATDYTLTISQTIQDFAGETLAVPVVVTFTTAPAAGPSIVLSPVVAVEGSADLVLTISGKDFVPPDPACASCVQSIAVWQESGTRTLLSTTFVNDTQVTAVVPAALLKELGAAAVIVEAFWGPNEVSGSATRPAVFQVISTPTHTAPIVTWISPASVGVGSDSITLTITGDKFIDKSGCTAPPEFCGPLVFWASDVVHAHDATLLDTKVVSNTELRAVVPKRLLQTAGTAVVFVLDGDLLSISDGGSAPRSQLFTFTVHP